MQMENRAKHLFPKIVFVGAHMESRAPLAYLIEQRFNVSGLVTLDPDSLQKMAGGVNLSSAAESARIPVLLVKNINEPHANSWIQEKAPDLLLVVGWTQLLKPELLRLPKFACLGFHASLLPKYRGRAPVNWAIIKGETVTGNTMIVLEPNADTGDIVAQRTIPITNEDTCRTVYEAVGQTEVEMLQEVLPLIQQGILPRRTQDDRQATVMPKRRPEDGRVDWTRSTSNIYNWIRALTDPYPGAFSVLDGKHLWIWSAHVDGEITKRDGFAPGDVAQDPGGWPLIATGDGWIRVLEAQLEGGSKLSGREAARTFLLPGTCLAETAEIPT
jgi:methionyl-tRNA formyltransferase